MTSPGIQGNPGDIAGAASGFSGLSDVIGATHSGLGSVMGTLAGWQGAGAASAGAYTNTAQSQLAQARDGMNAAGAAMHTYSSELQQAQDAWKRADTEETHLKDELAKLQAKLAQIQAANAAAEKAHAAAVAAHTLSPGVVPLTSVIAGTNTTAVPPLNLTPTAPLVHQIDDLKQRIQICEQQKSQEEARAKAASSRLSSAMAAAKAMLPQAVAAAATQLNKKNLPYVWGGGHTGGAAHPTGTNDYGKGPGLDCSGAVSWVLEHAGVPGVHSTPASGTMTNWFQPGHAGQKGVLLYTSSSHVFMVINGRIFSSNTENAANGGPHWRGPATPQNISTQEPHDSYVIRHVTVPKH
jgi:cell wall-associated NlpC family hydrolase